MKQPHPDFEPTVTRVAERMARVLLPQSLQPHTDSDDNAAIDALFAFQREPSRQDAADSDLDDETAINNLFAQQD